MKETSQTCLFCFFGFQTGSRVLSSFAVVLKLAVLKGQLRTRPHSLRAPVRTHYLLSLSRVIELE